jgi:hypothetical protein
MRNQTLFALVGGITVLLLLVLSSTRAAAPLPTTAPAVAADDDVFGSRLSGGTRSEGDHPSVFLLLPQTPAKTAVAHPTIYWFMDKETDADQVLVISKLEPRDGSTDIKSYAAVPYIRAVLRGHHSAGMQSFDLSTQPIALVNGTLKVTVSVRVDRANAAANPFSTGLLKKVDSAPAGDLWFDQVSQLSQAIGAHPDDVASHQQRRALLKSQHVFLTFVAPDDIATMKGEERGLIEKSAKVATAEETRILDLLDPVAGSSATK